MVALDTQMSFHWLDALPRLDMLLPDGIIFPADPDKYVTTLALPYIPVS